MMKKIISLLAVLTALCNFFSVKMQINVNTSNEKQVIDGWGTSACWWSQMIDDEQSRTELAKALFSKEGLGLNIYRYNVGGGVNPEKNRIWWNPSRNTESFYYFNEQSGEFEYDFTRDANAQAFLREALSYGCIDTVVLFANSPHYSMTISGEASGSYYGNGTSNISEDRYQDFVDYFLTITEYFLDEGIPVKYISPINEPQWDWGGDWVGQEGCHYDPDQVHDLLALFSKGIDERGLDVKLSCPDSGSIRQETWDYFDLIKDDAELYKNVGSFAYHSYWADDYQMDKILFGQQRNSDKYKNDKIEMSEWCELPCQHHVDDVEGAVKMARVISNDITLSCANSWTSWVAVNNYSLGENGTDKYSDGLLWASEDYNEYDFAYRYYALAHYSKFIPAGSVRVSAVANINNYTGSKEWPYYLTSYSAFKTPEGKTVIVIVNEDEAKDIRINTGILSKMFEKMTVYTTDSERKLEETYSGSVTSSIHADHNSITTVVIESRFSSSQLPC